MGESAFKIHSLVASIHSDYFRRLCDGDSGFKEGTERKAELKDDSPLAIKLMVDYFYAFDYIVPVSCLRANPGKGNPRNSFEAHSQMFTLADKYSIPSLRELAYRKFDAAISPLLFPTERTLRGLASNLVVAIPHIYNNTPPNDTRLREAVLTPWRTYGMGLLKCVKKEDMKRLFEEVPEFAVELLGAIAGIEIGSTSTESVEIKAIEDGKASKNIDWSALVRK